MLLLSTVACATLPAHNISVGLPAHNLSVGRAQLAAATAGPFAIFAGGYDSSGNDTDAVDILDTSQGSWTWSTARLSTGRGVIGATGFVAPNGTAIAVFAGGKHESGDKNRTRVVDIVRFDVKATAAKAAPTARVVATLVPVWSTVLMSSARSMVSAVSSTDGTLLFFAGGEYAQDAQNQSTKQCSDVVDVFDISANAWRQPSLHLSQARKKLAAAAVGRRVVFAGGYLSSVGSVTTVDILDVPTLTWVSHGQMLSTPRFRLQAAPVPDRGAALFISGQGCDWTCPTADMYVDDGSDTGHWTVTNLTDGGRYEFGAVAAQGKVVLMGGKMPRPKGLNLAAVDVFDGATMQWRNGSRTLVAPRYFAAAGVAASSPGKGGPVALLAGGNPAVKGMSPNLTLWTVEMVPLSDL